MAITFLTNEDRNELEQLIEGVRDEIPEGGSDGSSSSSGGLSTTAANLLIEILRNGLYSIDQSANITALAVALQSGGSGGSGDESGYYGITTNLTNVNTSNGQTYVEKDGAYTTTISAAEGCLLASVTVTMGGIDVTADVYSGGVITIETVTNNVVITAVAGALTLLNGYVYSGSAGMQTNSTRSVLGFEFGDVGLALPNSEDEYYPIPVPPDATKLTVVSTGVSNGIAGLTLTGDKYTRVLDTGWRTSDEPIEFEAGAYDFVAVNFQNATVTVSAITIAFA